MPRELKVEVLRRAHEIAGGTVRLAERLGVEPHTLEFWLSGRATLPDEVFVAVVDIVLQDDLARAAQDRRRDPVARQAPPSAPQSAAA